MTTLSRLATLFASLSMEQGGRTQAHTSQPDCGCGACFSAFIEAFFQKSRSTCLLSGSTATTLWRCSACMNAGHRSAWLMRPNSSGASSIVLDHLVKCAVSTSRGPAGFALVVVVVVQLCIYHVVHPRFAVPLLSHSRFACSPFATL